MKPNSRIEAACKSNLQKGFTLLEVLVAFVLLSLTLGVILQIFSGGLRNAAAARHYAQAAIIANSKLAMLGSEIPLDAGENSGEAGDYSWRMTVTPFQDQIESNIPATSGHQLYSIILQIKWQHGAHEPELEFNTYRLGVPVGF